MKTFTRPLLLLLAVAAGIVAGAGLMRPIRADDPPSSAPMLEDENGLPIADRPGPVDASPEAITKAVADLGSDLFADREAATLGLYRIGEPAREALTRAAESIDPEVKARAGQVLRRLDVVKSLKEVNVKFMLRGYCLAGSEIRDTEALGGFYKAPNGPREIPEGMEFRPAGGEGREEWYLLALPDDVTVFRKEHRGMRLLLVNPTKEVVPFSASDSRLNIVQEAKDGKGEWREVEYLPSSW